LVKAEVFEVSFFGGEPFLYRGICDLGCYSSDSGLVTNFFSNGTAIRLDDIDRILSIFRSGTIALNGLEECHDRFVRKKGAFRQTSMIIKQLVESGFPLALDVLVSASNLSQLESFLIWVRDNIPRISSVFINAYIPYAQEVEAEQLSQTQLHSIFNIVQKYKNSNEFKNKISFGTSIPYCIVPERYRELRKNCSAGWLFGSIDSNGSVRICSWSSEILGNILVNPLPEIWQNSVGIRRYRSNAWIDNDSCLGCDFLTSCLGGCKVTKKNPPYSVASNWKSEIHSLKMEETPEKRQPFVPGQMREKYTVNPALRLRKEHKGGLAYLKSYNRSFWVNDTALDVLRTLSGDPLIEHLLETLSSQYAADREGIRESLRRILFIFERMGLLLAT